jgi:hypothetical protein
MNEREQKKKRGMMMAQKDACVGLMWDIWRLKRVNGVMDCECEVVRWWLEIRFF